MRFELVQKDGNILKIDGLNDGLHSKFLRNLHHLVPYNFFLMGD